MKPTPFFSAGVDLARDQGLAAQHAVLVGEGQPHHRELGRLDAALGLARRGLAVVASTGPRVRPGVMRAYATSGGMVLAAQLEPLRRRASTSFQ